MRKKLTELIKNFRFLLITAAIAVAAGLGIYWYSTRDVITPLTNSWDSPVPNQAIPSGLVSLQAEDCGACHQKYYEEWQLSTHSHAFTDLQFQAELKKESSPFMCINCHIPLQNQQEYIVTGLINGDIYQPVKVKNEQFDPLLQQEGINCSGCHVRNGAIIGPTGSTLAPHPVVKDTVHLSEQLCISCHNANAVITPTLACTFQTGDEWKAGPYYGKKNCISCHMPETHRSLVEGYPERKSHMHTFSGSGIPKFDSVKTTVLNGLEFYPSAPPAKVSKENALKYTLKVKNEHAGHRVPSGDPERFILITMNLLDQSGKEVKSKTYRIGEEWEWYPEAKKLSDNNMYPGEERTYSFNEKVNKAGKYTLQVVVTKHRLSKENAEYNKLGDNYPLFITIFEKRYPVSIQ